jgi:hypothetical protein
MRLPSWALAARLPVLAALFAVLLVFVSFVLASDASAAESKGDWKIDGVSMPSAFSSNDEMTCHAVEKKCDRYQLVVLNTGEGPSSEASPLTVMDKLPAGMQGSLAFTKRGVEGGEWICSEGERVTCELLRENEEGTLVPESIAAGHYAPYLDIQVSAPSVQVQEESEAKERAGAG